MSADVIRLPSPRVIRALEQIAIIGELAVEGWRFGDRELVVDCRRWHSREQAVINRARRGSCYSRQAVTR